MHLKYYFSDGSRVEMLGPDALRPEGRVRYAYEIRCADHRVVGADYISGPVGSDFEITDAFAAWLTFMIAYAEAADYADRTGRTVTTDGDPITPEHRWAQEHSDELLELLDADDAYADR